MPETRPRRGAGLEKDNSVIETGEKLGSTATAGEPEG